MTRDNQLRFNSRDLCMMPRRTKTSTSPKRRNVVFEAYSWLYQESTDPNGEAIGYVHIGGLTEKNEKVSVRVEDFRPYVFLELPKMKRRLWTRSKRKILYEYIKRRVAQKHEMQLNKGWAKPSDGPCPPSSFEPSEKYLLHFKREIKAIKISFPSQRGCNLIGNVFNNNYSHKIPGLGVFPGGSFVVHERNVDTVIKFSAVRNLPLAGWIKAKEYIPEDETDLSAEDRRITSAQIDLRCKWDDISPYKQTKQIYTKPRYLCFDIECNSVNHNSKLPDPSIDGNVVFQIACIFGHYGDPMEDARKVLLTLFDPHEFAEDTEIMRFDTEKDLLLRFAKLVKEEDADIFTGYNIMKFDWHYMMERARLLGCLRSFMRPLSRNPDNRAYEDSVRWNSAAYGEQVFSYPQCQGRANADVLPEVERNHRLPTYSLNAVSEKFLGSKKDDISPRQLFMLYQITYELLHKTKNYKKLTPARLRKYRNRIETIMLERQCHGEVSVLRHKLLTCKPKKLHDHIREGMTLTGKYCVQDTVLPIQLAERLNLWTTMKEMSNVMHIPISYLHTRGQQVKVLAQMFRTTNNTGYIVPHQSKEMKELYKKTKFQGATVFKAVRGYYINVGTLDFASLYPTVMIAYNICFTTIVADDDPIPDSQCHVLVWEDHINCLHDPDKEYNKKKKLFLCEKHRYRFRRIQYSVGDDGEVTRKFEGILPRLERTLLHTRKGIKKEMAKAHARLAMNRGYATPSDIETYKKYGYEIIGKGSLGKEEDSILEIVAGVLNAKQLAVKVSCNSVAANTPIPCLTSDGFRYLQIEELFDTSKSSTDDDGNEVCSPLFPDAKVWTEKGWTSIKYVIRHKAREPLVRVSTGTGCVDVTPEHSLVRDSGIPVKPVDLRIDEPLLHHPIPNTEGYQQLSALGETKVFTSQLDAAKQAAVYNTDLTRAFVSPLLGLFIVVCVPITDGRAAPFVRTIRPLTEDTPDEYIYDLETENHHFAAGVGDMIVHNSMYGTLGARTGPIPLIQGAASVTAMGRRLILMAVKRVQKEFSNCELVYGDTDSCMLHFKDKSLEESWDLCVASGLIATHYLKCHIIGKDENFTVTLTKRVGKRKKGTKLRLDEVKPGTLEYDALSATDQLVAVEYMDVPIDLEFENMYRKYLLLTKKRYIAEVVNRRGEITGGVNKGTCSARRDNCKYLRDTYNGVKKMTMEDMRRDAVVTFVADRVNKLFTRSVPDTDYIIYMGVKNVMNYAIKKKVKEDSDVEFYVDSDGNSIANVIGPLDPRLTWQNLPQAKLALKMLARGTDVPANTRLEFLYIENPDAKCQGDKTEDYTYYSENKYLEDFNVDKLHYIDRQLRKPVTELITSRYPPEVRPFEKIEDAFRRVLRSKELMGELRYTQINGTSSFAHTVGRTVGQVDHLVGWEALKHVRRRRLRWRIGVRWHSFVRRIREEYPQGLDPEFVRRYLYRGYAGKAKAILASAASEEANTFDVAYPEDREVVEVTERWWARKILNDAYHNYGVKKRPEKRPTAAKKKVPKGTQIALTEDYRSSKRHDRGECLGFVEIEPDCSDSDEEDDVIVTKAQKRKTKKKLEPIILHSIRIGDKVYEKVQRDIFTPLVHVDDTVIGDMLHYHQAYRDTVDHLDELFCRVKYDDDPVD